MHAVFPIPQSERSVMLSRFLLLLSSAGLLVVLGADLFESAAALLNAHADTPTLTLTLSVHACIEHAHAYSCPVARLPLSWLCIEAVCNQFYKGRHGTLTHQRPHQRPRALMQT